MGILNVTPDSFYRESRVNGVENALSKANLMIEQGATWIDIGGESTRPGAEPIKSRHYDLYRYKKSPSCPQSIRKRG